MKKMIIAILGSEYTVLGLTGLVYYFYHILPVWFFILLMTCILTHVCMTAVLYVKKGIFIRSAFWQKLASVLIIVLFSVELLRYIADIPKNVYAVLEYSTGAVIVISIIEKFVVNNFSRQMPDKKPNGAEYGDDKKCP
jgi:phosphatidylglycerophosphate synthase